MLVLASNSPRRRQLLSLGGWTFRVQPADVDETPQAGEDPRSYVERLAIEKARVVLAQSAPEEVVVAADTTVADGNQILGKPIGLLEAWEMLRQLRGRSHQVYTGIALQRRIDGLEMSDVCQTVVPMRHYSDAEIEAYIATGDPFDKAGAYAIQHRGFNPVPALAGCYANVMGMPLCHLARMLRKTGIAPQGDLARACEVALDYECVVYKDILENS
jgi:MAF protein